MALLSAIKAIFVDSAPDFERLQNDGDLIKADWFHKTSPFFPKFLCAVDKTHFYFLAGGQNHPSCHPDGKSGEFQPELWKYDVAEFFLATPDRSSYLEFNLSPNGAWWSARFKEPRVALDQPPLTGVKTVSDISNDSWQVRAAIPLSELGPLEGALLNVTFILGSPEQRFFTSAPLDAVEPDFHRPHHFLPMSLSTGDDARQNHS